MKLAVFSHKACWPCSGSPTGYATDGGFPFQMKALSELFDETTLLLPCNPRGNAAGELALDGRNLRIVALTPRYGEDFYSKLSFFPWLLRNSCTIFRELHRADGVHTPIPSDVGTVGMLAAWLFQKPLFVRYCGNWLQPVTLAEKLWLRFMERAAGGSNVMLATGGTDVSPSAKSPELHWIFSTSLSQAEIEALSHREIELDSRNLRLITVGRQDGAKGTELLIQALSLIHRQQPNTVLHVVGDGPNMAVLKQAALELGCSDRVIFHGKVDHAGVLDLLGKAHLFCFPSQSEGFPKAVLEALACGLPVIATPISVLPLLLANGCGVLIEPAADSIAQAVNTLVTAPGRYKQMSALAHETAREYTLERWRDTIRGYLEAAWGPLKAENRKQKAESRNGTGKPEIEELETRT